MGKPLLSVDIGQRLRTTYGSLAQGATQLDIGYETLKKSVSDNRFSTTLLKTLFPDKTVEDLMSEFDFKVARGYRAQASVPHGLSFKPSLARSLRALGVDDADISFIGQNKAVAERIAALIHRECEELRRLLSS